MVVRKNIKLQRSILFMSAGIGMLHGQQRLDFLLRCRKYAPQDVHIVLF